ncbi:MULTISPECIES: DUF2637 domain-containing protein [unclassified Arthrobacter]|uniref:DUF2637 domain-containing protein n=1 Tax=unclassified Arthrobacter TaxID=235627 RepID=UPI001492648F|nr:MULTISPECIES: DUF2637 domain-containing protein [unclassified Arthrobacter]MBE0009922.1 DUF2637 domain-containing protein [Arthrobacter sp. AET 35A]NOJ63737.1 DUF2637 domain-containing protein [Arthrobacter sp. 147(2020)]
MATSILAEQAGRRWAVVTAVAGTVFIAAGAFWLSFTALADLAARSGIGEEQAWAWPLIVDGMIVVATVAVVALAGRRSAWYSWALLIGGAVVSVTANAIHAVVAADADVPGVLAASVAAVPPVVLLAITHLTVILTRPLPSAGEPSTAEETPDVSGTTTAQRNLVAPPPRVGSTLLRRLPAVEEAPLRAAAAADRRDHARELHGRGWSNKEIARELQVHPSTVGRWFASAHRPDDTEDAEVEEADN